MSKITKNPLPKKSDPHTYHWTDLFETEFEKESDRASVILAAAMLDESLLTLLKSHLVPIPSNEDPLFDGANSPLGTFSSKIDIAFRIGLISAQFARDLHLIRKIRNEFAHNISGCSFDDSSVRSRCLCLARSMHPDFFKKYREKRPEGPRGDFQLAVAWMIFNLASEAENAHCTESATKEFGYSPPSNTSQSKKVKDVTAG